MLSTRRIVALIAVVSSATLLAACLEDGTTPDSPAPMESTQGQELAFGGVGVALATHAGAVYVAGVDEGSPAAQAGLAPHDRIVSIDGVPTDELELDAVVDIARGEVGTAVAYEIQSGDGSVRTVTMERVAIELSDGARRAELRRDREFGGVGMVLRVTDDGVVVHEVIEGLPAESAGLRAGERIVAVDGVPTAGEALIDIIGRVRGDAGAPIVLDVADEAGETRALELERETIVLPAAARHCPHGSQR